MTGSEHYTRIIKSMPTNEERVLIDLSKVQRVRDSLEQDIIKSRKLYSPLYRRTEEQEVSNNDDKVNRLPMRGKRNGKQEEK